MKPDYRNLKVLSHNSKDKFLRGINNIIRFACNFEPIVFRLRTPICQELVPDEAIRLYKKEHTEETIKNIKKLKINLIITHWFKGFGIKSEREDRKYAIELSELCHKEGIAIGAYIQFDSLMYETFFKEFPDAEDWLQRDYYGNPILYAPTLYFRYLPCPNQENFIQFLKQAIKSAIRELKADLLHFDNINLFREHSCYCRSCLDKFRKFLKSKYNDSQLAYKRFGFSDFDNVVFPSPPVDLGHYNWIPGGLGAGILNDPLLQEWVKFRCESINNAYKRLVDYARSIDPKVICVCNPAIGRGNNIAVNSGADFASLLRLGDGFWAENENKPGIIEDNILVSRIRDFKIGRILNKIVLTYGYNPSVGHKKLYLAECLAFNRQALGVYCDLRDSPEALGEEMEYVNFMIKHEHYYLNTDNIADIAVYHSYPSLTYNWNETYLPVTLFEQTLIQTKMLFDIIFAENLKDLSKYKVLILPEVECMSDQEIRLMTSFVDNGGGLVFTGRTALYDEFRRKRIIPGLNHLIEYSLDSSQIKQTEYKKGRVVYIPRIKEAISYNYKDTAIESNYWKLPKNWKDLYKTVEWTCKRKLSINIKAPLTVAAELYKQDSKLLLHLVNYDTEKEVKDISVELNIGTIPKEIMLLTPDQMGKKCILTFKSKQQKICFQIPFLKCYDLIILH